MVPAAKDQHILPELHSGGNTSSYNLYPQDYIGISNQQDTRNLITTTGGPSRKNTKDKTFSDKHLTE